MKLIVVDQSAWPAAKLPALWARPVHFSMHVLVIKEAHHGVQLSEEHSTHNRLHELALLAIGTTQIGSLPVNVYATVNLLTTPTICI